MRNVFWGFIFVISGILLLLDNLDIADFSEMVRTYWPLILIILGLSIIMRRRQHSEATVFTSSQHTESDLVHQSNVFGDIRMSVTSQNFKGGSLSTIFGDCDLDISKVTIADGEHIFRVHGVFGNSTIILPKEAAASISANTVLGTITAMGQRKEGFSPNLHTSTSDYASASKKLKIIVSKVFGDIKMV